MSALQDIELFGGVTVSARPRIRSSQTPKFGKLARMLDELLDWTGQLSGEQVDGQAAGIRISSALLSGLDDETVEMLIRFAVEVLTKCVIEGVDEDYATLAPEARTEFIDLNLSPIQLVTLFLALWPRYAVTG